MAGIVDNVDMISWLETRIPPLLLLLIAVLGVWWLALVLPQSSLPWWLRLPLAVVLLLAGLVFCLAGLRAFRRVGTTVNPVDPEATSTLVRSGVYRLSRNPMYLGFVFLLLAQAVWLQAPFGLVVVAGFIAWVTRFQIVPEDRALRQRFGDEFTAYCAGVRRWL